MKKDLNMITKITLARGGFTGARFRCNDDEDEENPDVTISKLESQVLKLQMDKRSS